MDWSHPLVVIVTQNVVSRLLTGRGPVSDSLMERIDQLQQRVQALQASLAPPQSPPPPNSLAPLPGLPGLSQGSAVAPARTEARPVSTSCLACARAHLRAVQAALEKAAQGGGTCPARSPQVLALRDRLVDLSARLKEALRFAREDGMHHPEVTRRLERLADEVVVLERFDAAPEVVASLPPGERQVVERVMPDLRRLRQRLSEGVRTPEDLILAAADAGRIGRELYGNPYLHFADEELSALLAYDLSAANLARAVPSERRAVEPVVADVERLRDRVRRLDQAAGATELAREAEAIRQRLAAARG